MQNSTWHSITLELVSVPLPSNTNTFYTFQVSPVNFSGWLLSPAHLCLLFICYWCHGSAQLPGLDAPQALSVPAGWGSAGSFCCPWAEPSSAFAPALPSHCPLLRPLPGSATSPSPATTSCFHRTQIFALFFFRLRWKLSLWAFDIAQNTLNAEYRNISVSLHHFLLVLGAQLSEGARSLLELSLLPANSPTSLLFHSKEGLLFGPKPEPLFTLLLLFASSVFLTHPIVDLKTVFNAVLPSDCPRRVVLPSQAILSKLTAQLSTFLEC